MTPPLKPCPFCGEAPRLREHHYFDEGTPVVTYSVCCASLECEVEPHTYEYDRDDIAARTWNTRVPEGGTTRKRVGTRSKASGGTTTG